MNEEALQILLALLVGTAGSILFRKMKVPAGALIGALIFSSVLKITTNIGMLPVAAKTGVQIIAGAFVGQRVRREDLRQMRSIAKPICIYTICVMVLIITMGYVIERLTILDLPTALLAVLPGGITEISMVSGELGADSTQTTVLQTSRYIFSLLILPQVNGYICSRYDEKEDGAALEQVKKKKNVKNIGLTAITCITAGVVGKYSGFPAGALVFAMVASASINIRSGRAQMPISARYCAQTVAGVLLGTTITMADIQRFPTLIVPVLLVLLNCLLINFGISALLRRITDFSMATCLFSCVPAGMSDMALISLEMGGDAPKVMAMQLSRYMLVLAVMPSVIKLLTALAG